MNSTRGLTLATQWSGLTSHGRDGGAFRGSCCARPQKTGVNRVVRMTFAVDEEASVAINEEIVVKPAKFSKVGGFLFAAVSIGSHACSIFCITALEVYHSERAT